MEPEGDQKEGKVEIVDEVKTSILAINEVEQQLERIKQEQNAIENSTEKSIKKGKTVDDLKKSILQLEAELELPHKGISSMKKKELEKYLGELCDMAIRKDTLFREDAPEQKPVATEMPNAQPPISQQLREDIKQQMHHNQVEALKGNASANSLFHFNLICMFLLESTTEKFEDQLHGSITGATRELREDYAKPDSPLRELYMEIYAKYGKTIEPYMDPVTKLAVYNLSIVQRSIKRKIEKKKDQQNDT